MTETNSDPNKLEGTLTRTIFKNTLFITLQGIILKLVGFLFNIFVARYLGDDRLGQYATVLAFVGLFQILAELGLSQYVMREIARDRTLARTYFWNLVTLRLILGILGIIIITGGAILIGYSAELVAGIFVYTLGFLLSAFLVPIQVILTANERLDFLSGAVLVGQIITPVLGTIFLLNDMSYVMLIVASLISILPQIGLGVWGVRLFKLGPLPFQITPRLWGKLIRSSLPFGIISLALTIDFSVDTFMLSLWLPDEVIGWYNVAYGLVRSLLLLFSGFMVAIVPSLSRTYVHDTTTVEKWYYRTVKFSLLISIPVAIGGTLLASELIELLYTSEYAPASLALRIIVWDMPFLMLASLGGQMTTITTEEHAAARVYVVSAIANVLLNLFFIPRYSYLGASIVTVLTDLIVALQFYFLLRKKMHLPSTSSTLLRVLIAASIMGAGVWMAKSLHVLIAISLGASIYGIMILAVRVLDQSEWDSILSILARFRKTQGQ